MQKAETVLNVIHARGKRGLKLKRIYRQLYNPDLYLLAYANLYANKGALTPGATKETVDGMSLRKIHTLIDNLRHERFRWTPVRRVYIPKKDKKSSRSLGLPTWTDKLLQEVIRLLLEAYYEPQFSEHSHGFRPQRGCHTALMEIKRTHKGTKWFIEGDIAKCFDSLDHEVLLNILRENIEDTRFIRLIDNLLKAGYMENWKWRETHSGAPQGGVLSPLLSNIYLDRLDKFVEKVLIPNHHRGEKRQRNPEYRHWAYKKGRAKKQGDKRAYRLYDKKMRTIPTQNPHDPHFRRLKYVRYADDFLLSFAGPKTEAEEIKQQLTSFVRDELCLDLSQAKTLISHAVTTPARFLGYDVQVQKCDTWRDTRDSRNANGEIALKVPPSTLQSLCARYMRNGKPIHRSERIHDHDFDIVFQFQAEYRGFVQYYSLAQNLYSLNKLRWVMESSLLKTLANKHRSSVRKMAKRFSSTVDTKYGPMKAIRICVEREGKRPLHTHFGGIPLRTKKAAKIIDRVMRFGYQRNELIDRLLAEKCELCASTENLEVHHIRKLSDLNKPGRKKKSTWAQKMAAMHRKTLVVCKPCHVAIHTGKTRAAWGSMDR